MIRRPPRSTLVPCTTLCRSTATVEAELASLGSPVRLIRLADNEGRARGRNRLVRHARGRHLLFLDSDMLPDSHEFLGRWMEAALANVAVCFGGFTVDAAPRSRETALHRALSRRSDCLSAVERRRSP